MDGSPSQFPPLPPLQGEALLEVFTHKSLGELVGLVDNERYIVLGSRAFELILTHCIFKQNSQCSSQEIEAEVKKHTSDETFSIMASQFKLREKLRYNPTSRDKIFTPEGARDVFLAYIGGVYSQHDGHRLVESWVQKAFYPNTTKAMDDFDGSDQGTERYTDYGSMSVPSSRAGHESIRSSRISNESIQSSRASNDSPPMLPLHKPRPSPPVTLFSPEPPRPSFYPPFMRDIPPHMSPHMPDNFMRSTVAVLPKFNEITTRLRYNVQWKAEQTGMQHAPLWKIECYVNNELCGSGTGTTKQLAKEEAAKEAYLALRLDSPYKY